MKKLTAYLLALGMSTLPYIKANVGSHINDPKALEKRVLDYKESLKPHWNLEDIKEQKIPALNKKIKLSPLECAKYSRMIAKKEYKKEYTQVASENRIYHDKVIAKINEKDPKKSWKYLVDKKEKNPEDNWKRLDTLAMTGELQPGMIVGFYYKYSHYANSKDEKGKKVIATHNAIYRGSEIVYNEKTGKEEVALIFDHQWGSRIERIKTKELKLESRKEILYPTYVADEKSKDSNTYFATAKDFNKN
ncbi:MAG: hypothetical protein WC812_01175 [Candidatus Pacearchaeota archaeon]|jgi:hypothetical protein